ncbi:hypothetical protein GF407_17970 [candidate division KSB1 bacterium]|nr:hypothetical protein [candidate division KSB1 bacterium]
MKLTVVEPAYFPTLKICSKIAAADKVIFADTFKFKKHSLINRTPVKSDCGKLWLTIPVYTKGQKNTLVHRVKIVKNDRWKNSHLKTLYNHYHNAPYFYFYIEQIQDLLSQSLSLDQLLLQTCLFSMRSLHLSSLMIKSSDLVSVQDRTERVIRWLEATGCTIYLLESFEKNLIDIKMVTDKGFDIYIQEPYFKSYHQQYKGFIENLSILDLVFNEGELSQFLVPPARLSNISKQ